MIQILGLRSFIPKGETEKKSFDKPFPTGLEIKTVQELFEKLPEILSKISKSEHWNLFYTVANCAEKRVFVSTTTIAFDLDGIELKYQDRYIDSVLSVLKLRREDIGIVLSGNGLHFLLHLKESITDKNFFTLNRPHYKAVCDKINAALEVEGLPGKADTTVFDARRILRLPGTVNRKPDKPEKLCTLLQPITKSLDFKLDAISDLPQVSKQDQVDPKVMKKYSKVYPTAVLEGCSFLKHCADKPNEIDEPQWYAALSVTARLEGEGSTGHERSHQLSRGHRGYSSSETDTKIEQALLASGPRTCDGIAGLWHGCAKCPNFQKVTSPIMIAPENAIRTENSGFHNILYDGKGNPKSTPNHEDLIKFLNREKHFKVLGDSRHCYVWQENRYVEIKDASLEAFGREKFIPTPTMETVKEFRYRVEITNIKPIEWWENSLMRKMNFLNGYLDIDSMEFRPHDQEIAFRNVLPYEYDAKAKAPVFDRMMDMVSGSDKELRAVLEEFMGYSLSNDDCWAQKALVLTGEGSNGKSTFLDALFAVAGDDNFSTVNLAKVDEHYNLAMFDKKLFNVSEETSPKALTDNQTFKNLVTGGRIIVRLPRESPYQICNKAKLILTCNDLPNSNDNTHGFYRRLLIVPFNQLIEKGMPDYDPHLTRKIREELAGVLNIALAGYKRLVANKGFTESAKIKESLEEYRLENDTVLYWVKEHLVVHQNGGFEHHFTSSGDLYAAYRDAMKSMSRIPVHEQKFFKQLSKIRGDVWGEHPYQERAIRRTVQVQGRAVKVRGIQGVEIEPLN